MVEWGHAAKKLMLKPQAAKENIILSNFKLNLDESLHRGVAENHRYTMPHSLCMIRLADTRCRSSVSNIADYLKALHKHVVEDVTKGFAKNYDPDTFRYCLTVPAMWSDLAKHSMRKAAVMAGLIKQNDPQDRLILISEPEAAALYCERMCEQVNLKKGDRMLICDAGGGTVDLIVFEVIDDRIQSNNRLKEVTKGIGESCGSVFLDEKFKALMQEKLGDQAKTLPAAAMNNLMDQFVDNIKPEFDGLDDQYLSLPVSISLDELNTEDDCLDEGTMALRADELKEKVFEPVVERVVSQLLIEWLCEREMAHNALLDRLHYWKSNTTLCLTSECHAFFWWVDLGRPITCFNACKKCLNQEWAKCCVPQELPWQWCVVLSILG